METHQVPTKLPNVHLKKFIKNTDELKALLDKAFSGFDYEGRRVINGVDSSMPSISKSPEVAKVSEQLMSIVKPGPWCAPLTFINKYTGDDWCDYHTDIQGEDSDGLPPMTFTLVSIGASRTLKMIHKETRELVESYVLEDGDVLFLNPSVQEDHLHGIEKEPGIGVRYSLLFPLEDYDGAPYWIV